MYVYSLGFEFSSVLVLPPPPPFFLFPLALCLPVCLSPCLSRSLSLILLFFYRSWEWQSREGKQKYKSESYFVIFELDL